MRTIKFEKELFTETLITTLKQYSITLKQAEIKRVVKHYERLCYWNITYNLTAILDTQEIVERHFVDCILALKTSHIEYIGDSKENTIDDIGSGGGFPGLVIAALYPEKYLRIIESVQKKSAFQEDVLHHFRKISPNTVFHAEVLNIRAEQLMKIHHVFTRATFSWNSKVLIDIAKKCQSLTMWVNEIPNDQQWQDFTLKYKFKKQNSYSYYSYEKKYLRFAEK